MRANGHDVCAETWIERKYNMSSYILHITHNIIDVAGITKIIILTTPYTVAYPSQSQLLQFLLLTTFLHTNKNEIDFLKRYDVISTINKSF